MKPPSKLSPGQHAYETRRAAKAGTTLDKHLATKQKDAQAAARAAAKAAEPPPPPKKPTLLSRLIDRAHQPLKPRPAPRKG